MQLSIVKSKNSKQFYVLESFRKDNGKNSTRVVRKLGTYDQLIQEHEDPEAWARGVVDEMNRQAREGKQKIMVPFSPSTSIQKDDPRLYDGGYLFLQKLFCQLHLDDICKQISKRHGFSYNLAEILGHLVYARILNPASKMSTYEYAQTFLEKPGYGLNDVYRALEIIGEHKDEIQASLYQFSKDIGKRNDSILYYDCTNYYFEIEQERGNCKYGPSKEHRPNPIVEMGLFMDGDGIPLAFCIHSGNTNEQKTLKPLEQQIMKDFGHSKFIVCTDAGLSSSANRKFNNMGERAFITTQSIKKMKDFQKEWALSGKGWHLPGHKELFDLNEVLASDTLREKYHQLNEEKIRDEERNDGFYAVATNLDDPPEEIIKINHRRWEIEECFRIMKHEFAARPVYVRRDTRITAHFTVCFLALVLFRYLEKMLGHRYTCEQIIHGLRNIKFLKLDEVGFVPTYTRTDFTDGLHKAFGFRTDYEILSKGTMRHIVSLSKKR